jgi:hypothetical protein
MYPAMESFLPLLTIWLNITRIIIIGKMAAGAVAVETVINTARGQQDQQGTPRRQAVGHQDSPSSHGLELEIYTKNLDLLRQPPKMFLGWRRGNKYFALSCHAAAQGGRTPWSPRTESSGDDGGRPRPDRPGGTRTPDAAGDGSWCCLEAS